MFPPDDAYCPSCSLRYPSGTAHNCFASFLELIKSISQRVEQVEGRTGSFQRTVEDLKRYFERLDQGNTENYQKFELILTQQERQARIEQENDHKFKRITETVNKMI